MKSPLIHLSIALCALIASLSGYGAWYAAVGAKSASVANLERQIAIKTDTMSRITSARASLAEIAGNEKNIQSYFVSETGVVAFIDALESQARAQRATLDVLSVSAGSLDTRPMITFTLAIKGTFDAVMRTIGAIEYAPYDLSVSALLLGQDGSRSWHANLTIIVGSVSADTAATSNTPRTNTP